MKLGNLSILGVSLATALAATACNRADETASTYDNEPATTAPATSASQPAPETTTPASTAAGTNTAATDTTSATDTAPTTVAPATTTMADATTSFDDMDINNDGSLSQDELSDTHPLRQAFTVVDSDGNGTLSRSEVDSYRDKMAPPGG
ncbi:hypothetical protein ACFPOA_07485 [Lysobacter niabensis]|uniref:hypothetical protein n=1 Tax=Agrilutibacter niabensis TaxID=380628 RepID=UPI00360625D9